MNKVIRIFIITIFTIICGTIFAQEKPSPGEQQHEMSSTTIKELDAFPELLHPLVYKAYPNKDFAAIKEALPRLVECAATVKNVNAPKNLIDRKKAYKTESRRLYKQLADLNKKKDKLSDEEFGKRFLEMHDTFEKVMEITR